LDAGPFAAVVSSFELHLAAENKAGGTIRIYAEAPPGDGIRLADLAGIRYNPDDPDRSDVDLQRREIYTRGKRGKDRIVRIDHEAGRLVDRYSEFGIPDAGDRRLVTAADQIRPRASRVPSSSISMRRRDSLQARRHCRRGAAGLATARRSWIHPGRALCLRAASNRTRARR
jgi:hypothetical protein